MAGLSWFIKHFNYHLDFSSKINVRLTIYSHTSVILICNVLDVLKRLSFTQVFPHTTVSYDSLKGKHTNVTKQLSPREKDCTRLLIQLCTVDIPS